MRAGGSLDVAIEETGASSTAVAMRATDKFVDGGALSTVHGGPLHAWSTGARLLRSGGNTCTVRQCPTRQ